MGTPCCSSQHQAMGLGTTTGSSHVVYYPYPPTPSFSESLSALDQSLESTFSHALCQRANIPVPLPPSPPSSPRVPKSFQTCTSVSDVHPFIKTSTDSDDFVELDSRGREENGSGVISGVVGGGGIGEGVTSS